MLRQIPLRNAILTPRRVGSTAVSRSSFINTTRLLTTQSLPAIETLSPPTLQARTDQPKTTQAPAAPAPRQLTYSVGRTASYNICVYNDKRSGGTRKETTIKNIQGSAQDLKNELINELNFSKHDVVINPVTGHVKIKGWHLQQVKTWLEARGF